MADQAASVFQQPLKNHFFFFIYLSNLSFSYLDWKKKQNLVTSSHECCRKVAKSFYSMRSLSGECTSEPYFTMSGEEPKTGHADLSTKHDAASLCTIISTTSSESKVRNSIIDYTMSSTYKLQ